MKSLIVYYSLEGNTRWVAGIMAKKLNAEILELKPKNDINSSSIMKYLWGGKMVTMGQRPELEELDKKAENYDLIVIGTPIWAWTYVPAIATWLTNVDLRGKKIAMYCCCGGDKGKVFENLKSKLVGNDFVAELELKEPLNDMDRSEKTIDDWVVSIRSKMESLQN